MQKQTQKHNLEIPVTKNKLSVKIKDQTVI